MDKSNPPAAGGAPGISIRYGPMEEMDIDGPVMNGHAGSKRKARSSTGNGKTYKEATEEDEEDDEPIVINMPKWPSLKILTLDRRNDVVCPRQTPKANPTLTLMMLRLWPRIQRPKNPHC